MPNDKEILIFSVNEAIETVYFNIKMDNGDSVILSSINFSITCIDRALEIISDNDPDKKILLEKLWLMNEYQKAYGQDSYLYINLRNAISFKQRDELDEFDIDEIKDIIEEIKDSDNIQDKLAIAILASMLGKEYKTIATETLREYLNSGANNIFISQNEIISMYNNLK